MLTVPTHEPRQHRGVPGRARGHPAKFRAGERFCYCNSGYVVLALIAEGVSAGLSPKFVQDRVCRPAGCRCARGELHGPYAYLSVAGRMVYVPAVLAGAVRSRLEVTRRVQDTQEEVSVINLELLARRELD